MLDLGEGNVVEKLDEGLADDILLLVRKSFNSDEDEGGSNNKDVESMDA